MRLPLTDGVKTISKRNHWRPKKAAVVSGLFVYYKLGTFLLNLTLPMSDRVGINLFIGIERFLQLLFDKKMI